MKPERKPAETVDKEELKEELSNFRAVTRWEGEGGAPDSHETDEDNNE